MPERVKVGVQGAVRSVLDVGDAGGVKVEPQHVGPHAHRSPGPGPHGLTRGPLLQVLPQQLGHVGGQGLHLPLATLVAPGSQGNGGRTAVEVERLRGS
jgi:hypothetical protein